MPGRKPAPKKPAKAAPAKRAAKPAPAPERPLPPRKVPKPEIAPRPEPAAAPKSEPLPLPRPEPVPVFEPVVDAASLPRFVREASPAQRKAVVEALALDAGVAPILARAPWRKPDAPKPPAAPAVNRPAEAAPPAPPKPAPPPLRMTSPAVPAAPRVGVMAKRPVILDTNALMMQFQFHIDVEREIRRLLDFAHEVVVPSVVVGELESLAREARGKDAGEARMAVELARTFKVMDSPGDGDTAILRLAEKVNAVVVTNDKVLRARLRAKDIPNIYMRSSAFLTIEGHVSGV